MRVRWTQHALDQATDLGDDLYERSPERAQAVLERILDRVGALAELPWFGPPWKVVADPPLPLTASQRQSRMESTSRPPGRVDVRPARVQVDDALADRIAGRVGGAR